MDSHPSDIPPLSPSPQTIIQHPLQEVSLTAAPLNIASGPSSLNDNEQNNDDVVVVKNVKKENWVKFDDDVNDLGSADGSNDINKKINLENTSAAAAAANRLTPSPIPPPMAAKRSRSRSPQSLTLESSSGGAATQQQQQHLEPGVTTINAATTPVQKTSQTSSTMPDVTANAPAVLTTESIHVDLSASGKQQQHQQLQSNYQKSNSNNNALTANSQQQQQHNHHQLSSTAGAATLQTSTHSAAHQPQHHHHHQQHHNNNNGNLSASSKIATAPVRTTPLGTSQQQNSVAIPVESQPPMRTIELSTGRIREGFANGDVIVTLLPANTKWPWVTPAIFRPELVPEELMAQGLTLTVEEYVHAMETLVNDYRFTVYNICYKRILVCWILFAFTVLLTLLFSGLQGVALFSLGVGWLFLNAAAIFLCMWVKLRLSRGLEKCLARVNKQLIKHKILLILDDRGRISCHKVNLCFLYFDSTQCVSYLNEFLEHTEQNGGEAIKAGWEAKLDIDMNDIVIQGSNPVRLSRKQAVAQELYLSYLQRWGKDFLRRRLDWTVQEAGVHETPRHLQSSICPCQYEEEVLRNKIKTHLQSNKCCGINCLGCWL